VTSRQSCLPGRTVMMTSSDTGPASSDVTGFSEPLCSFLYAFSQVCTMPDDIDMRRLFELIVLFMDRCQA
jgi:hypothetical protein